MNLLEAKKAFLEGKKIRHTSWGSNDFCSNNGTKRTVNLGIANQDSARFFEDWMARYADGWEIYVKKERFFDMKSGQKFIHVNKKYMKVYSTMYNALDLSNYTLCVFDNGSMEKHELVDEAS